MKTLISLVFVLLLTAGTPLPCAAADLLSLSAGWYDFNDNEDAVDFRLEYRWDAPLLWVIEPWAGLEVTSEGALFGLGGFLADIRIGSGFTITPSWGAGLYHDGDGKDLGHVVEFRSQLEMGWEFEDSSRAGISFSHISNAGLDNDNPGTEVLSLYYHVPVDFF